MDSTLVTFDPATEEAASLFVLELLPPDERQRFTRRLDGDPSLRALVRDLQGNIDSLVMNQIPRSAPVHVWGRIAAEVGAAPIHRFPAALRTWGGRLLAAAACLALGAILQARRIPKSDTGIVGADSTSHTATSAAETPANANPQESLPTDSRAYSPIPQAATVNSNSALESDRLRERVLVLASQVAALNEVLNQQSQPVTLPSGVSRLHVFRMTNTNSAEAARPEAEIESWPDALAALASRQQTSIPILPIGTVQPISTVPSSTTQPASTAQSTSTTQPTGTTQPATTPELTGTTQSVSSNPPEDTATASTTQLASNTSESVVDSHSPAVENPAPDLLVSASTNSPSGLLNEGQPIGFFDPDTGRGAIAFKATLSLDQSFVVWYQSTTPEGTILIQNVGNSTANVAPGVISFLAPSASSGSPNFFITLEPAYSAVEASAPTGPVVAHPLNPNP